MKRIKTVGIVAMMAMALTAVAGAGSASADGGFAAEDYPATIHGEPTTPIAFGIPGKFGGGETCSSPILTAGISGPAESTTTSAIEDQAGCSIVTGSFEMNGCQLTFRPGSKTVDIGPSGCGPIRAPSSYCGTLEIPSQTGITASFTNNGEGHNAGVRGSVSGTSVTNIRKNGVCGIGTFKDLSLNAAWQLTASSQHLETAGLVSSAGALPVGIAIGASPETGRGVLDAQAFPLNLTGGRAPGGQLTFVGNKSGFSAQCGAAVAEGGTVTSQIGSGISLAGQFSSCELSPITNASANMNSCAYTLGEMLWTEGKPYKAISAEIACENEGDAIEIGNAYCTVSIPEQVLYSSGQEPTISLENSGSGILGAGITAHLTASSVDWIGSNTFLCKLGGISGAHSDGAMSIDLALLGTYAG